MRTCTKRQMYQAKDFIESREEGFMTHLAEGGSNLSGGLETTFVDSTSSHQGSSYLYLDDLFLVSDYRTDAYCCRSYDTRCYGIDVAQRVGTIMDADHRLSVLDMGEIVGRGQS